MDGQGKTRLEQARAAYEGQSWAQALAHFRAAESLGAELLPEDLERMATSAWLTGVPAQDTFGSAHEAYETAGRIHDAARVAIDLVDYHAILGEFSLAQGWGRRAARALESAPEGPGHARLAIMEGFIALLSGRVADALDQVERAHELARRHGDEDAEALALSRRARLLLRLGRMEEATADVDEAMLLVHRDRTRPISGAMIYCNTIDFCRDLGDFERALEWTEAATRWTTERQVCAFPGVCRVHRAELLRLRGEHAQAETETQAAIELFRRHRFRFGIGYAFAELGLQRLESDDLDAAQEAFREAVEVGHEPLPGAALLSLRRGDAAGARAMLETALEERADNPLGRARLLPALVSACIELGDLSAARAATDELRDIAGQIGTVGIQAHAQTAAARIHLAAGDGPEAIRAGRSATRAWNMIGACYELAQARELLARAYAATGDQSRAQIESERARVTRGSMLSPSAQTMSATSLDSASRSPKGTVPPLSDALPIREGTTLDGKIEIGPVLGIGGMGIVHAGKHRVTGRSVAVKVLKHSVCGDSQYCERFLHEARACGRIRHPNVVDIYDAGMHGEEPYIVMERLEGRSLEELIAAGERPPLAETLAICELAARGVSAAHEAGVIHRDLKPGNVFVVEGEGGSSRVKVLDFGISKQPDAGDTRPGQLLGTPFYMSPEQILNPEQVDERTDVYALGAVLFELLAGRPPYFADSVPALLYEITKGAAPDLRADAPSTPDEVERLVLRALARDPNERFASARELADALADTRETLAPS